MEKELHNCLVKLSFYHPLSTLGGKWNDTSKGEPIVWSRVIILLAFVLSLGVVSVPGGGALFGKAYAAEHESGGGKGGGKEPKEGEPGFVPPEFEYFELQPLLLPVITSRGVTEQVSLVVSLELPYGKKKEVSQLSPRLADAYIQDLYGVLGSGRSVLNGGVVDVKFIKDRLTEIAYKVLGQENVKGVLLQVIQQRQL